MPWGLELCPSPSAALVTRPSLLPVRGWRVGAPPRLTVSPAPAPGASEDTRQQEKDLFHPRTGAAIQSTARL